MKLYLFAATIAVASAAALVNACLLGDTPNAVAPVNLQLFN